MIAMDDDIRLYGAARCHKSRFYQKYLADKGICVKFLDVEKDRTAARELHGLYSSGKLNFPTLVIKGKKLRDPSMRELDRWLIKKGAHHKRKCR